MKGKSIYSWFGFIIPMYERFRLIKEAGFDSTCIWWGDEFIEIDGPKEEHPEFALKAGLDIINVHLPFIDANDLWLDGIKGDSLLDKYMKNITDCCNYGIPAAVVHLTIGWKPPEPCATGLDRIKRLTEHAEAKGVNIALENLKRPEYVDYAFSAVTSERLGFCYDSGHEAVCGLKSGSLLEKHGGRLMVLHLHDNDGLTDRHMVPGEGILDWKALKADILKTEYTGPVLLEVTNEYSDLKGKETAEEFLRRAAVAADRILDLE